MSCIWRVCVTAGAIILSGWGFAQASTVTFASTVGLSLRVLDADDPLYRRNTPYVAPDFSGLVWERSFETDTSIRAISTGNVAVDTQTSTAANISNLIASVSASVAGVARNGATILIPEYDARAGFIVENTSSEIRSFIALVDFYFNYLAERTSTADTAIVWTTGYLLSSDTGDLSLTFNAGGVFLPPGQEELLVGNDFSRTYGFQYHMQPGDRFFVGVGVGGDADIQASVAAVPLMGTSYGLLSALMMLALLRLRRARF